MGINHLHKTILHTAVCFSPMQSESLGSPDLLRWNETLLVQQLSLASSMAQALWREELATTADCLTDCLISKHGRQISFLDHSWEACIVQIGEVRYVFDKKIRRQRLCRNSGSLFLAFEMRERESEVCFGLGMDLLELVWVNKRSITFYLYVICLIYIAFSSSFSLSFSFSISPCLPFYLSLFLFIPLFLLYCFSPLSEWFLMSVSSKVMEFSKCPMHQLTAMMYGDVGFKFVEKTLHVFIH